MISFIFFFGAAFAADKGVHWTVEKTESVLVVAFDEACVQVQRKSGERIKLARSGFSGVKLLSKVTQVEIHPDTVKKQLCK